MMKTNDFLDTLNPAQRAAAEYGLKPKKPGQNCKDSKPRRPRIPGPLLVIAGAGTGKTNTLAHRVACLVIHDADPNRIMMLTFTKQAAREMKSRVNSLLEHALKDSEGTPQINIPWAGTFHSVALMLIGHYGQRAGLPSDLNIHDRNQSTDLMDIARHDLGFAGPGPGFPKKSVCLEVYSKMVNAKLSVKVVIKRYYPQFREQTKDLGQLFEAYVALKQANHVVDYDDLLLYWDLLLGEPDMAREIGGKFDHILVDEFQDTNVLQASIIRRMKPDGMGVTVVGDDAQSIYAFRAARVRNILDFPQQFEPPAEVIKLEQNYRSTKRILKASNAVINLAGEGFKKKLIATVKGGEKPRLVTVGDVAAEAGFVADEVQKNLANDIELKRQAVLFRLSYHSKSLELELARRHIPFRKIGGRSVLESAHLHDVVAVLKWAQNPKDRVSGLRVLKRGVNQATARKLVERIAAAADPIEVLIAFAPPAKAAKNWGAMTDLMRKLHRGKIGWPAELDVILKWYRPYLEHKYDNHRVRAADLDQLATIAGATKSRRAFLTDFALDQPDKLSKADRAPNKEDDYLTLSTIHGAKGREWHSVFMLSIVEGSLPAPRAETKAEIDEERRLLYVAMTRAMRQLTLTVPWRSKARGHSRRSNTTTTRSRFIPDELLGHFDRSSEAGGATPHVADIESGRAVDLYALVRQRFKP